MNQKKRMRAHLNALYGRAQTKIILTKIEALLADFRESNPRFSEKNLLRRGQLSQRDVFLILYGDQFTAPGASPLKGLNQFLKNYIGDLISGVHLLPFFPYSSDDGFSITDYRAVRQDLGTWQDIRTIGQNYRLMFDAVINHVSQHSAWFKGFLKDAAPYNEYFVLIDLSADLSQVIRPRTSALIKMVHTPSGLKNVWTTFSEDQVDLNFANPFVLLEIIDLLLFYVEKGAEIIRLDAVAYLWKEIGTPSINLPQTHLLIKLFRAVLDEVAPSVLLITETNVPHEENVKYFGNQIPGSEYFDEAQLVYQFSLAPLVLHTFITGNAQILTNWAMELSTPSQSTTFFNFIASHDGIGVIPAHGLLDQDEINALLDRTIAHGGYVSYRTNADGTQSPYELNITLFDALNNPNTPPDNAVIDRFMASQVIMLSLAGMPGIYIHSLFGSHNSDSQISETGALRSVNRKRFKLHTLGGELEDPSSLKSRVFSSYRHLLQQRRKHPAFHPNAKQRVLTLDESLFTIVRGSSNDGEIVVCIINVSDGACNIRFGLSEWELPNFPIWQDLIGGEIYQSDEGKLSLSINGYQAIWLIGGENADFS